MNYTIVLLEELTLKINYSSDDKCLLGREVGTSELKVCLMTIDVMLREGIDV